MLHSRPLGAFPASAERGTSFRPASLRLFLAAAVICTATVSSVPVEAQANKVLIRAGTTGWYDSTGSHNSNNSNYIVGGPISYGTYTHNFFVFDLSAVGPQILSADLLVTQGVTVSEYPYETSLPYDLYDISTPTPTLISTQTGQTGIYQDLGSGTSYGTFNISTDYTYENRLDFTLNQAALQDLNAHRGDTFAIGGALDFSQIPLQNIGAEYTFAATSGAGDGTGFGADLALTIVPEASTTVSFGLLLALGGGIIVARKKKAAGTV